MGNAAPGCFHFMLGSQFFSGKREAAVSASSRSSGGIPDSPPGQAEILEWSAVLGVL